MAVNGRQRVWVFDLGTSSRQCYICDEPETTQHLLLGCPASEEFFRLLNDRTLAMTGKTIDRSEQDVIYLKRIFDVARNKSIRRNVAHLPGWDLHIEYRMEEVSWKRPCDCFNR